MPCCAKDHFESTLGFGDTHKNQLGMIVMWFATVWIIWEIRNDIILKGGVATGQNMFEQMKVVEEEIEEFNGLVVLVNDEADDFEGKGLFMPNQG
ncbi:hypothetical protein RJT34_11662 [Clitoria ternatea]|uniref:Uncharacterized protein n=1 Tax=Clitoria ternatea TaxID=43366 RepID=A0AAN9JMG4_CLITE